MIGIYKITSPSGRVYIGQSWDVERRFRQYKNMSKSCSAQRKLWNSFNKYGVENHTFEILYTYIYEPLQEDINKREKKYWALHNNCEISMLNIREVGSKGKMSEETKELLRKALTGRKQSSEERAKHSGKNHPMYGRRGKLSPFWGRIQSKEQREKHSQDMLGKKTNAKKTINLDTGKIYISLKEAASDLGISYDHAKWLVNGKINKKKINLIYYANWDNNSSNK